MALSQSVCADQEIRRSWFVHNPSSIVYRSLSMIHDPMSNAESIAEMESYPNRKKRQIET
jgi:hypothetical protein